MRRSVVAWSLVVSLIGSAGPLGPRGVWGARVARADEPTGRALFDEADKLMKAGKIAEACEKFAASQHEFGRSVTLLRLADCYVKIGKTASAWSTYREVKLAADAAKQKASADVAKEDARIHFAAERITHLEPLLVRARLVAKDSSAGLVVKRDGEPVSAGAFGLALPVDPGKHVFEATAEGKLPWRAELELSVAGTTTEVTVPVLEPVAAAPGKPAAPERPAEPSKPGPTGESKTTVTVSTAPPNQEPSSGGADPIAIVTLGAGVIGMGVGGLLGLSAKAKYGNAESSHCNGSVCDAEGKRLTDEARSLGNTATVFVAVGGALAAVGVVLWVTSPSAPKAAAPAVGLTPNGVVLAGSF